MKVSCLTGNEAVGEAVVQSGVEIIPFYPITPQSEIGSVLQKKGVKVKQVDSEHSVLNYAYGYSLTGKRVFTATSSQGLAYMSEVLPFVSGQRIPIVLSVVNRVLALPWSINPDLSDSFAQRDYGWIQIISKNVQEVYNDIILSFKLTEKLNIPIIVNMEGFYLSHAKENLNIQKTSKIRQYLKFTLKRPILDCKKPLIFGGPAKENYSEFKAILHRDMKKSCSEIKNQVNKFNNFFNSKNDGLIEKIRFQKNKPLILCYGFISNLVEYIIKNYKLDLNLIRIKFFRPFPFKELNKYVSKSGKLIVIDNCISPGSGGVLFKELNEFNNKKINLIVGLGGEKIEIKAFTKLIKNSIKSNKKEIWYNEKK